MRSQLTPSSLFYRGLANALVLSGVAWMVILWVLLGLIR